MNGRRGYTAPRPFARPARSAHDVRADWLRAIEMAGLAAGDAKAMAEGAQAAPSGQAGQVLTRLAVALRDLAADNFPMPGLPARVQAQAFLTGGRAFVEPVGNAAEVRGALAAYLAAMAALLDGLMAEQRRIEAGSWRSRTGERDD